MNIYWKNIHKLLWIITSYIIYESMNIGWKISLNSGEWFLQLNLWALSTKLDTLCKSTIWINEITRVWTAFRESQSHLNCTKSCSPRCNITLPDNDQFYLYLWTLNIHVKVFANLAFMSHHGVVWLLYTSDLSTSCMLAI
jgi:hypothetical protein